MSKPIPFVREEVLKHDLVMPDKFKSFRHMKTEKLEHYETYYSEVLEALAGEQVWRILDALEYIATVINERKESR
jgi:hypothetical protein